MKLILTLFLAFTTASLYSQSVKIQKIQPTTDTLKAEGQVYSKGDFSVTVKADISSALMSMVAEIKNENSTYVHIAKTEAQVEYNKTSTNAKGISKTTEKSEKEKLEDVILAPSSTIIFKETDKLNAEDRYRLTSISGYVQDDKILTLTPTTDFKEKLGETPISCGGFYNITFSLFVKKVKTEDAYLSDGSPAYRYIPYLVIENGAKQDVTFKGKLEFVFSFEGLERTLKFNLPNLKVGEKKTEEAKGEIPIVNYIPKVYYIQMLNTPEVTFKD